MTHEEAVALVIRLDKDGHINAEESRRLRDCIKGSSDEVERLREAIRKSYETVCEAEEGHEAAALRQIAEVLNAE